MNDLVDDCTVYVNTVHPEDPFGVVAECLLDVTE